MLNSRLLSQPVIDLWWLVLGVEHSSNVCFARYLNSTTTTFLTNRSWMASSYRTKKPHPYPSACSYYSMAFATVGQNQRTNDFQRFYHSFSSGPYSLAQGYRTRRSVPQHRHGQRELALGMVGLAAYLVGLVGLANTLFGDLRDPRIVAEVGLFACLRMESHEALSSYHVDGCVAMGS